MAGCASNCRARPAGFGQSFSFGNASERHVGGKLRPRVTKLELHHVVRHLDNAPPERLGAALRCLREEQSRDVSFRDGVAFNDLDNAFGLHRRKIRRRGLHLGVGQAFGRRRHEDGSDSLRSGKLPCTAFEVGNLLNKIGGGQTGQDSIFRTTGPLRAVTGTAGTHVRFAAGRDDVGHRRMSFRVPVRRKEKIARLLPTDGGRTARQVLRHIVGGRGIESGRPRVGPGQQ